jgi:hypothetical protein
MKRIDIFVTSSTDVQKERCVVERLIRLTAAEFSVPVRIAYSNRLRKLKLSDKLAARTANGHEDGRSLLFPCFWEYQDFTAEQEYRERIPNTGQYDLVICILWSRLGTKISPTFVMPDGSQPASATEYEIAWALDQMKRTPGFPELHVYRNLSTPVASLEPREERETSFQQWDALQEFFSIWKSNDAFSEACNEYQDLREFENLFRKHFRDFIAKQLDREIVPRKPVSNTHYWKTNPFRGLQFFNFNHAAIFHGRTKAIGEVLDVLKKQASAGRPFVLILGPSGSGKSSLVRAGVLPFLAETGPTNGPWRRAIARPGAGAAAEEPFNRLAAALLAEAALPELQDEGAPNAEEQLASELRENPQDLARRVTELLDRASLRELDRVAGEENNGSEISGRIEGAELARHRRLTGIKPDAHLALVVDPLEELFTGDFSPELQHRYIAALAALIRSGRVFVIATLQSDFYATYQQFPELIELTGSIGRYDLQPPTPEEIEDMIRLPAEAAGLHFEPDRTKGCGLDETILDAAVSNTEPLPLLEHLLSELYRRQATRQDGLLRWSDYLELGEFDGALGNHAETLFTSLNSDAQEAFDFVMRRLVSFGNGDQGIRQTLLYRDVVSPPELDRRQKGGAKTLVDSFVKEGLLYAEPDLNQERIVCISHQALLRSWPRVRQWLAEDKAFLRMRDRLDASLNLWVRHDRQCEELLGPSFNSSDAETLLRHYRSSLNKRQIDYIEKILAAQGRHRRIRDSFWSAAGGGLAVLAAFAAIQWYNGESRSKGAKELERIERNIAEIVKQSRNSRESELKRIQNSAQTEQTNTEQASDEASANESELNRPQDQVQASQKNADLAAVQLAALEVQLKQAQDKAQAALQNADRLTSERGAMEVDLKQAKERAQLAEQNAALATSDRPAMEAELKNVGGEQTTQDQKGQINHLDAKDGATADPTPNNEPISSDQDQSKLAQNEQNQTGDTPSNPTIANSPGPSPHDPPAPGPASGTSEEQQIKDFVADYLQTVASDDISTQKRFFAHRVAYFDQGVISLRQVEGAKESYDRSWPKRDWKPQGEPEIHGPDHSKRYEIVQPYTWAAFDGSQHDQGSGTLFLRVYKTAKGKFHIVHIERRN